MASNIPNDPLPDTGASTTDSGKLYLSGCSPGNSFVPECEVFLEGEGNAESKMKLCTKYPDHTNFIRVKDFTKEHLPVAIRTNEMMKCTMVMIARTVLITVKYISVNRPDTYHDNGCPYPFSEYRGSKMLWMTGTGYLSDLWFENPVNGPCPCHECKESGKPQNKYWKYRVVTATHVVFDDSEAEKTVITCFYDSEEDLNDAVRLYGVSVNDGSVQSQDEMCQSDFCDHLLCVTHDEKFAERIRSRIPWNPFLNKTPLGVIVSHPHGYSKRISIGEYLYYITPVKPGFQTGQPQLFVKEAICDLPSNSTGEIVRHHFYHTIPIEKTSKDHYHDKGATFTLPDDSKYAVRYDYNRGGVTFPPGTIFQSRDKTVISIPDNALFKSSILSPYILLNKYSIVAYNIPTCPGSSGAMVPWHEDGLFGDNITHTGCDQEEGFNRSSVYSPFCNIDFVRSEFQRMEYDTKYMNWSTMCKDLLQSV